MNQNMNQKAEKIYNIEHVDSIHIDMPGMFTTEDKYNVRVKSYALKND